MFSGNFRLLIFLLFLLGVFSVISPLKYFILILSWSIIIICLVFLFLKTHSKNVKLQTKLDSLFLKFVSFKFIKLLLKFYNKLNNSKD